ncbi:hypothetical protein PMAYCL1PPCAC_02707 [Pristionchus mayeri]|uniref:Uncharacterized protein n=1 Tax=Pristionchus mayeri TaxID=1317129 RepID=A0AAN4Z0X1_9BILA|nr:hypothetical protein PMAYCL1PPCAC_02707 [Pristionchus mayeri]
MGTLSLLLPLLAFLPLISTNRLNQRLFVPARAISFVDPTKHGFRVILHDSFIKTQLAATLIPMVYLSAIPLKRDAPPSVQMIYPDSIYDDKTISVTGLLESSWYYVCVEWENVSRHNETVGSDCRMYKTLDRTGKKAETTIEEVGSIDTDINTVFYRLHTSAEFPLRITVSLKGGPSSPPAQVFFTNESTELEGSIPNLRQFTNYGRLCVLEEPLVPAYSATGRVVTGLTIHKCYNQDITTKDYALSTFDSEQAAYRTASSTSLSVLLLILLTALSLLPR